MTKLPEPNFIERDADKITQEWVDLYEKKSGKVLQPAQIERLMIDSGAYRENLLRVEIQQIAKKNLLSYAPIDILEHIGEPLGVSKLLAFSSKTTLRFSIDEPLDFDFVIPKGTEVEVEYYTLLTKTGIKKIVDSEVNGSPLVLSTFAVGDGGDSAYEPTEEQTQLLNETYRNNLASEVNLALSDTKVVDW